MGVVSRELRVLSGPRVLECSIENARASESVLVSSHIYQHTHALGVGVIFFELLRELRASEKCFPFLTFVKVNNKLFIDRSSYIAVESVQPSSFLCHSNSSSPVL